MPAQDGLFSRLFDDASLFPPASLAMPDAVQSHLKHQAAWYSAMCGPFVCASSRITQLSAALTAAGVLALDLALVVPGGAADLALATDAVAADPRLRLRAVEVPIRSATAEETTAAAAELAAALDRTPLAGAAAFVEIPCAHLSADAIAVVGERRYRVKLRTGGVTAESFPSEAELGRCITLLAADRLPFKCTAGLHHAVRHWAEDTGFEHHGFLNVLLAVAAALDGAGATDVAAILADQDGDQVAAGIGSLGREAGAEARSMFTSLGTCSTEEPVTDLVTLGLATEN
jgi:hypothetical protein